MKGYLRQQNDVDEVRELRKRLLIDLEGLSARLLEAQNLAKRAEVDSGDVAVARDRVSVAKIQVEALLRGAAALDTE